MRWEIAGPVTLYLVYRSYSHASLTPFGILIAAATAIIHALHPSPLPFTLLVLFFLLGTSATKIKKEVKATLTLSSTGSHIRKGSSNSAIGNVFSSGWNKTKQFNEKQEAAKKSASTAGGQEPRSAMQVLANSGCATFLCLRYLGLYGYRSQLPEGCFGSVPGRDLVLAGIIANYAAVMADTLSSELGILSGAKPRFILNLREVPPGTNGGITGLGLGAGLGGALVIGLVSALMLPTNCNAESASIVGLILAIGSWGALGSVLDSILGALFQASVVDKRHGKIVEAPNGGRVLVVAREKVSDGEESKPSRFVASGTDIMDNNQVNISMAVVMTIGAILLASWAWGVQLSSLWTGTK